MTANAELVEAVEALEPLRAEWDALACALGQPYLQHALTVAWWRHRRPPHAGLRVVAIRDVGRLIGVAPWFVHDMRARSGAYRLIGARSFFRMAPLAAAGREHEVAVAVAGLLARTQPRPARLAFEGIDAASPWPQLLARGWLDPPRASVLANRAASQSAPTMELGDGGFAGWLAGRSTNFRRRLRVSRGRAAELGMAVRQARTPEEFERDLRALVNLHRRRWDRRGGTGALVGADEAMLREAGSSLVTDGRARLYTLERHGIAVAAHLTFATGGEVATVIQGFDPDWEQLSPGLLVVVAGIEDAFARGDRRIDFGAGAEAYKWRLTDTDEPLAWRTVLPAGRGAFRARGRVLLQHGASRARARARAGAAELPSPARRAIRRVLARVRR